MTTKYLTGAYPGGYTLSAAYTGLDVEAGAYVGGTGVDAASFATIQNDGVINATAAGHGGVDLAAGGTVTNGSAADTTALIEGGGGGTGIYIQNASGMSLGPRWAGGRGPRPAAQPQAMDLADHRVAGDTAQPPGDLRRRKAIKPELGQGGDAGLGPFGLAALAGALALIATWVFLPSLALTLLAGLLGIAANPAYYDVGWVWVKAATGILLFEAGFSAVAGPLQAAAKRSAETLAHPWTGSPRRTR